MCIIDEIQCLCGSMHISFACLELVVRSVGCRLVLEWAVGWSSAAYPTACLLLVQAVSWCSAAYSTTGAGCKLLPTLLVVQVAGASVTALLPTLSL